MKVLFHYDCRPALLARLAQLSGEGIEVETCPETDAALFDRMIPGANVLWHVLKPVSASVIARAGNLRLIQKIGVGVNTIDLEAAKAAGIAVCNMPGTNSRAVAEMTLLLMLAVLRRHARLDAATRRGEGWKLGPELFDDFGEVHGRNVGLVGFGAVPRILAPILSAMGARPLYNTPAPKDDAPARWCDLATLLEQSDIVSLHLPLTPDSERMIDAGAIGRMKPGAILINTARGGLIDGPALVAALKSGRLGGAGLDVFDEEPLDPASPLLGLDNVVLMPHLAWLTPETIERSIVVGSENCRRLARGEPLLHRVV
jgi:phosphoglycerate dehydrogenase-like enzyme